MWHVEVYGTTCFAVPHARSHRERRSYEKRRIVTDASSKSDVAEVAVAKKRTRNDPASARKGFKFGSFFSSIFARRSKRSANVTSGAGTLAARAAVSTAKIHSENPFVILRWVLTTLRDSEIPVGMFRNNVTCSKCARGLSNSIGYVVGKHSALGLYKPGRAWFRGRSTDRQRSPRGTRVGSNEDELTVRRRRKARFDFLPRAISHTRSLPSMHLLLGDLANCAILSLNAQGIVRDAWPSCAEQTFCDGFARRRL